MSILPELNSDDYQIVWFVTCEDGSRIDLDDISEDGRLLQAGTLAWVPRFHAAADLAILKEAKKNLVEYLVSCLTPEERTALEEASKKSTEVSQC